MGKILGLLAYNYGYSYDSVDTDVLAGIGTGYMIGCLIIAILGIIASWKLFTKAGKPGWACLIPIYNMYVMFDIVYGKGWKFLLLLVPFLNFVVAIMYPIRMAQVYGKDIGIGILNLFFSPIVMLVLAFGNSEYTGSIESFV